MHQIIHKKQIWRMGRHNSYWTYNKLKSQICQPEILQIQDKQYGERKKYIYNKLKTYLQYYIPILKKFTRGVEESTKEIKKWLIN